MKIYCLVPQLAESFKKDIVEGRINPEQLAAMTSKERHAFLAKALGETNAAPVNSLFESKLLLKNKQAGYVSWARRVLGEKTPAGRDVISRVQRMEKVLSEAEEAAFLEDLASQRLGTHVSFEEAGKIADLSRRVDETKTAMEAGGNRLEYGRALVDLQDYVGDLKIEANKPTIAEFKRNPAGFIKKGAVNAAGLFKSMKASLDNSVIGRQGLKILFTHPTTWLRNSKQTFVDMAKVYGGKTVMREVKADVLSRPNALKGLYNKEKLAVGVVEEAYPTSLPGRVPVLGRAFRASEEAFTAFQYRTRADIFDKYVEIAQKSGGEIEGIGRLANSLTGRGHLGKLEPISETLNNVFFSPRLLRSNIDTLTGHAFDYGELGTFAKKRAALNTVKVISGIAAVLAIAKAVDPDSVETDARSADFGKIKVGDTRFDVSGGLSSLVTLAARISPILIGKQPMSKSSTTGELNPINAKDKKGNAKFGAQTGSDVVYNFFENKLSPATSVAWQLLEDQDFEGKRPTALGIAKNLLVPISITNYEELKNNPNSANILAAMIADGLGIGTNTYSPKK